MCNVPFALPVVLIEAGVEEIRRFVDDRTINHFMKGGIPAGEMMCIIGNPHDDHRSSMYEVLIQKIKEAMGGPGKIFVIDSYSDMRSAVPSMERVHRETQGRDTSTPDHHEVSPRR